VGLGNVDNNSTSTIRAVGAATSGTIAGISISGSELYQGTGTFGNSNTGFYLGSNGTFSLKDKLTWDGTTLTVNGGGTFSGALSAATGTFAGSLSAATGTFAGSLSAATGTFSGSLSAATGTFGGSLDVGDTVVIDATRSSNDANGRPTALLLKNSGAVSGDDGSVCMEMRSAARWHHVIQMNGYTNPAGAFDLSAEYRLGKSVDSTGQNDNYSTIKMMLNGGGLIIPDSLVNAPTNFVADAGFTHGNNIFFNSNNAATNNFNYGRMHLNEYFNTFFIDVPGGATHSSGSTEYDGMSWVMRKRKVSSGTYYSSAILKVDTNEYLHAKRFTDIDNTAYYLAPSNTGDSLRVAGDVVAYATSDKRLKDNIKPIENALDKVNKISGVTFQWNEISQKETGKKDVGVIAQEIEEILPELVETRSNGYKAVDYPKLTALLIEAVKDLSNQVKELKNGVTE